MNAPFLTVQDPQASPDKAGTAKNELLRCYNNRAYRKNGIYPFGTEQTLPKAFLSKHYSVEESQRGLHPWESSHQTNV